MSPAALTQYALRAIRRMTPDDARAFLNDLPRFAGEAGAGYQPGLKRIRVLLAAMDDPHEHFRSVHVAGTNGKGSTASFLAAISTAAGNKTGLHTSPELFDLTERMRIDGAPPPDDWLASAVSRFRNAIADAGATFFEATVALSFLYFAEENVDLAVVEVGLGGRLDATNVLRSPAAALVTRVGRDHTALLGDTLPEITREKAGIVKSGVPVLVGKNEAAAREVVRSAAEQRDAPWHYVPEEVSVKQRRDDGTLLNVCSPRRRYERLAVGLPGNHQRENALLALRTAEEVLDVSAGAIRRGLAGVRELAGLRGRGEVIGRDPLVIVDAAHNPLGLRAALREARAETGRRDGQLYVLLGLLRDKDAPGIAKALAEAGATVCPAQLDAKRAQPADALARRLAETGVDVLESSGVVHEAAADLRRRIQPSDVLLAAGSHHVVREVLRSTD